MQPKLNRNLIPFPSFPQHNHQSVNILLQPIVPLLIPTNLTYLSGFGVISLMFTELIEPSMLMLILCFEVKGLNVVNCKFIVCFAWLNTILRILVNISHCFERYTMLH